MAGHAIGNLLIAGLWERLHDPVAGLDMVGRLLNVQGRVLPMSSVPLDIEAEVIGMDPERPDEAVRVRGQDRVARVPGRVVSVRLVPDSPPACPETLEAVNRSDYLVFGPGSWFTSVIPHLLVPDLRRLSWSPPPNGFHTEPGARRRDGGTAAEHIEALAAHANSGWTT